MIRITNKLIIIFDILYKHEISLGNEANKRVRNKLYLTGVKKIGKSISEELIICY